MEWVWLFCYGVFCGYCAYLFSRIGSPKDRPQYVGLLLAATVFAIVVLPNVFLFWLWGI